MKKFLGLAALLLIITACSDDDSSDSNNDSTIVGAFVLTEMNVDEAIDLNDDGTSSTDILVEAPCLDSNVSFSQDGTYVSMTDELFIDVVVDGNETTTIVTCDGPYEETGMYSTEGNVLTITPSEEDEDTSTYSVTSGTFTVNGETLVINTVTPLGQVEFVYERQ